MAVVEGNSFVDQSIQVGGVDMFVTKGIDGIKALLISNDQNDIGTLLFHKIGSLFITRKVKTSQTKSPRFALLFRLGPLLAEQPIPDIRGKVALITGEMGGKTI